MKLLDYVKYMKIFLTLNVLKPIVIYKKCISHTYQMCIYIYI